MKITVITDAWTPQVNGVVRTYENVFKHLADLGIFVEVIHPQSLNLKTLKMPGYPEIDLVINPWKIKERLWLAMYEGKKIHIATEGPLGLFAKFTLNKTNYPYTTCYHTQFPEFIQAKTNIPAKYFYPFFRNFHSKSKNVLVPTIRMKEVLEQKGFERVKIWTRGVDRSIFNPSYRVKDNKTPYLLCVSRVSVEKGLDDFCKMEYPKKVLIGDGPYLNELMRKYPEVHYLGKKEGKELAYWYANAEAFVFPSKTDTFGIVLLESISCGTPIIAYNNQPGPLEVVKQNVNGFMCDDLNDGISPCLDIKRDQVELSSHNWTWRNSASQFLSYVNG